MNVRSGKKMINSLILQHFFSVSVDNFMKISANLFNLTQATLNIIEWNEFTIKKKFFSSF